MKNGARPADHVRHRRRRSTSPDQVALHTYGQLVRDAAGSRSTTPRSTAPRRSTPTRSRRPPTARRSSGRRTASSGPTGKFGEFYFDETGDTNATSPENDCCGGWTSVCKLTQNGPSAATGKLTIFYKGDQAHAGFDNVAFFTKDLITFVEDAGDGAPRPAERARLRLHPRRDDELRATRRTSRCAGSPKAATHPRRSTPTTPASARTRATTRSPGSTSPTATRGRTGSSGRRSRTPSSRRRSGASSTPSSTATTRRTRSFGCRSNGTGRAPRRRSPCRSP